MNEKPLGKLIGNTGNPNSLALVPDDSFSVKRGEFIRLKHIENKEEGEIYVLGRIISISRNNIIYMQYRNDSTPFFIPHPSSFIPHPSSFILPPPCHTLSNPVLLI